MKTQQLFKEDLGSRRYDLDWVRIGAFMVLIFYHIGMYYVTWDWQVKSPHASTTIEPLMMLSSPWRLSLLFLVSGVATGYLLARQGAGNFLGRRSIRLLLPLAFGMAVIVPPQSYLEVVEKIQYSGSFIEFWRLYITGYHGFCRGSDCLIVPTWNHLWFVAYLWVYTAVLYLIVRLAPPVIPWLRRLAERRLSGIGIFLWPIAYLYAIRLGLVDRFPSTHALIDDWYAHALYFAVFLLGFALAGTRQTWVALERGRWISLGLSILAWGFLSAYLSAYPDDASPPPLQLIVFARGIYATVQWLAIAAVVGFAYRHLQFDSPARRYLTTAIFPVYILHQTVIVVLAHSLQSAHLYAPIEALLMVLVTLATCFLGYEVIRRVRFLRPLFGLAATERGPEGATQLAPRVSKYAEPLAAPQDTH